MENSKKIDELLGKLSGTRVLTALELNDIRFSGRRSVITPRRLRPSSDSVQKDDKPKKS